MCQKKEEVTSDIPEGQILRQSLFSIFMTLMEKNKESSKLMQFFSMKKIWKTSVQRKIKISYWRDDLTYITPTCMPQSLQ